MRFLFQFIFLSIGSSHLFADSEGVSSQADEDAYNIFKEKAFKIHMNSEDEDVFGDMIKNDSWEKSLQLDVPLKLPNTKPEESQEEEEIVVAEEEVEQEDFVLEIPPEVKITLSKYPVAIKTVSPIYPPELKRNRVTGKVRTRFFIDENGRVVSPRIQKSVNRDFNENVIKALRRWKFSPAERNGEAVKIEVDLVCNFRLIKR